MPYFDRKMTAALKGAAIIIMFVHHFFAYPEWYVAGISYPALEGLVRYLRSPLKVCVAMYGFLTGYFYHFSRKKTLTYALGKIRDLLVSYWLVLVPLLAVALVTGCYRISWQNFLPELVGLKTSIMAFCWYVYFYILFMLLLPLLCRMAPGKPIGDALVLLILPQVLFGLVREWIPTPMAAEVTGNLMEWYPCVFAGLIFGRYGLFEKLPQKIPGWLKLIAGGFACLASLAGRSFLPRISLGFLEPMLKLTFSLDMLWAPLMLWGIAAVLQVLEKTPLPSLLEALGKKSMLMWFINCAFFGVTAPMLQQVLYFPKNPVLVLLWGLMLCWSLAWLLDLPLQKLLKAIKGKR